jgi:hypothetical protein
VRLATFCIFSEVKSGFSISYLQLDLVARSCCFAPGFVRVRLGHV